jgi:hypothetical protein
LPSNRKEGLRVVDLGSDGPAPSKPFYSQVKNLLDEAIIRIRNVEVRAIPGDHCTTCDFGELCRNSRDFGEGGSPFAQED